MKTTYIKLLVGFIVFLWGNLAKAQDYWYMGGIADGSATESVINNTCSTPYHFYAYAGGIADGAAVNTIEDNTCGTPNHFFAYAGGDADGAAVNTLADNSCGTPNNFFAYFGGDSDGASSKMSDFACTIVLPVANFTSDVTTVCAGGEVQFNSSTSTDALAFEWTFPGGTLVAPSTLTSPNPKVKYSTAGSYAVTLKVRNFDGTDTKTVTGYILVSAIPPAITNTTPGTRCGAGSVTLGATTSFGTVEWYAAATGGTALGTGTTFNTPVIGSTTTFYAQAVNAVNGTCKSATRTAVVATVTAGPNVTVTGGSRCGTGTVTLSASTTIGTLHWYADATGGTEIGTGTTFITPSISATTTYYVEGQSSNCTTERMPVVATVNTAPTITATTPGSRCGTGAVTLSATASSGTINWYTAQTGGSWLASGTTYSPTISTTTTFYVSSTENSCEGVRTAVVATINEVPAVASTTPGSRCGAGTVTLSATASTGATLSWFAAATGGTALGTGTSFTTPSISSTTTYYVEAGNGTCNSSRIAVTATVNVTSAPTGNSAQTFCQGELVSQLKTIGSNVQWYDAATGGNLIPGNTALVSGTTYYASQTVNSCESSNRLAVTATLGACLGLTENQIDALKLYPNPITDVLNIKHSSDIERVEMFTMTGQRLSTNAQKTNHYKLDLRNLSSGMYIVKVYLKNGESKAYKVIKK